ncbi:MAG: hypothetical protein NTY38_20975 [Acidobacteria bacterium]|nr:hypothetical protein [Acidobacteriota bacterium]
MLPRSRVLAALAFSAVDVPALEYHPSPTGFFEHGSQLQELWSRFPDDFGAPGRFLIEAPRPECHDADGRYHEFRRDEWGVLREYRIFGEAGMPVERPLDDWSRLAAFAPPPIPCLDGGEQARAALHRGRYYLKSGWISLFEQMHGLRRFEDVLMDIAGDGPEIHRLADVLVEHNLKTIDYLVARGVDAIQFGDDYGTQDALILSPRLWRRFFKERYRRLVDAAHRAGKAVLFHTCGRVRPLLEDLAEVGVDAIWPQLNVYDLPELAQFSRQYRVAVALHPDRGRLMVDSRPDEVRRYVEMLAGQFRPEQGGSWFYVEIDAGFPFANVEALTTSIAALRGLR